MGYSPVLHISHILLIWGGIIQRVVVCGFAYAGWQSRWHACCGSPSQRHDSGAGREVVRPRPPGAANLGGLPGTLSGNPILRRHTYRISIISTLYH
eukprot:2600303-Pyramimonas_sp.AAC.1